MTTSDGRRTPRDRGRSLARGLLVVLLVGWLVAGAGIVFLPIGSQLYQLQEGLARVGGRLGAPSALRGSAYGFALNMVLFAVPAFLAAAAWPRVHWLLWTVLAGAISVCIEVVQGIYLPRVASRMDVLANTLGAVLGLLLFAIVRLPFSVRERRRRRLASSE